MAELKPCPFCGGKPYLETSHRAFIKAKTTKVAYVRCRDCEARTQRFELEAFGHTSRSEAANKKAIEAWNRRAESEELKFTRQFIHEHGLEFALVSAWNRRVEDESKI